MSLAYVAANLFMNVFIFIEAGGHLGFFHFRHFFDLNPFFLLFMIFCVRKNENEMNRVLGHLCAHIG